MIADGFLVGTALIRGEAPRERTSCAIDYGAAHGIQESLCSPVTALQLHSST
jgi:hypothetical protein